MKIRPVVAMAALIGAAVNQNAPSRPQNAANQSAQDASTVDQAIADRMMAELKPTRTARIALWAHPDLLPADEAQSFAQELEKGLLAIEKLTGEQVDRAHYGDTTVHVFVSGRVTVSHVYAGYSHASFNRPYLYLNPQRVRSRSAPYLHELTHIVLWRFGSHSLREGFASYVEGRVSAEGTGYNSGVFGPGPREQVDSASAAALRGDVGAKVLPWIGRSGGTDPSITGPDSPETRSAFYLLTRSFVQHLLDRIDLPTFIALYRADNTEAAYPKLTGRALEQWRDSWRQSLARSAGDG